MHKVSITMYGKTPSCNDKQCALRKECANHCSAGDFRSESGFAPNLVKVGDEWQCDQKETTDVGLFTIGRFGYSRDKRVRNLVIKLGNYDVMTDLLKSFAAEAHKVYEAEGSHAHREFADAVQAELASVAAFDKDV